MQKRQPSLPYRFFSTADGSPTLELYYSHDLKEYMHNSHGAFEESVYIYGKVINEAFATAPDASVLSVGLGLGYNELITASLALNHQIEPANLTLTSYEREPFLRDCFLGFLQGSDTASDFAEAYTWIVKACAEHYAVTAESIRLYLLDLYNRRRWHLREDFDPLKLNSEDNWTVLLYDAFSSKMSPQLWEQESLEHLFQQHTKTPSFFTTYAAKGALNRALRNSGFEIQARSGFAGKRQSTYAIKRKPSS